MSAGLTHERHAEDWHEWSIDMSDRNKAGELVDDPMRLFVRNQDGAIEIVEAAVTSGNPGARELEQGREAVLFLQRDTAEWLHGALGKALAVGVDK